MFGVELIRDTKYNIWYRNNNLYQIFNTHYHPANSSLRYAALIVSDVVVKFLIITSHLPAIEGILIEVVNIGLILT